MPIRRRALADLWLVFALGLCACSRSAGGAPEKGPGGALENPRVSRGDLASRFLLTGELEAARGDRISVPRVPTWQVSIKWLEIDGSEVKRGEKVIELDNTPFASELKEKEAVTIQTGHDLAKEQAEKTAEIAEKEFQLERRQLDYEKAQIEAATPELLRGRRDSQEKELALKRAEVEFEKAKEELAALRKAAAADIANRRLALEKSRRDIQVAEEAIRTMTLTAPRDGIFVVADHPWEGRKLAAGDSVWVGLPIASLPDLASLQVVAALFDVDDGKIAVGQDAFVVLDAYPELTFPAKIVEVAPVARETGPQSLRRAFRVVARLERVDARRMRPGFSVKLIVSGEKRRSVPTGKGPG